MRLGDIIAICAFVMVIIAICAFVAQVDITEGM